MTVPRPPSRMNRRRFFRTQQLAGAAVALPPPADAAPGDLTLVRVSRRAMATTFEIALPLGTPDAVPAAEDALDLIDDLEDQLTVYRDHSEVSRLNGRAATEAVPVEPGLFDLLSRAATLTRDTGGAFDVATGVMVRAWKQCIRTADRIPTAAERAAFMRQVGMRHVVLDPADRSVKFLRPVELDLGAIGKGYALDWAAERLREKWGIRSALLHGGGSSVLAVGTPPGDSRGWVVAIRHPWDDTRTLGAVRLADRALGTSAATFQFFVYNNRKYGHVLDPRTGFPAEGTASASVTAPTAAEADALSTAFFVLGAAAADRYCRPRPGRGAVVLPDDAVAPAVFGSAADGYMPPGFRLLDAFLPPWD